MKGICLLAPLINGGVKHDCDMCGTTKPLEYLVMYEDGKICSICRQCRDDIRSQPNFLEHGSQARRY